MFLSPCAYRDFISPSILKTELGIEAERKQYDEMMKIRSHSAHSNLITDITDGFRILASAVTGTTSAARVVSDIELIPTNVVAKLQTQNQGQANV